MKLVVWSWKLHCLACAYFARTTKAVRPGELSHAIDIYMVNFKVGILVRSQVELEPFAITPLAAEGPVDVKIRIEAEERAVFGERWRFTLKYARPGAG